MLVNTNILVWLCNVVDQEHFCVEQKKKDYEVAIMKAIKQDEENLYVSGIAATNSLPADLGNSAGANIGPSIISTLYITPVPPCSGWFLQLAGC